MSGVQASAASPQFLSGANRVPDLRPDKCLSEFTPVSLNQVKKLIDSLKLKSCSLDPVPSWLVKTCADELLPIITSTINLSLMSGEVPEAFKTCLITPLLKKSSLDRNDLKNYRPIANLPFLDKVLERFVSIQLRSYLECNDLFPTNQSAYRHHHLTETALLKVANNLLLAADNGLEACLVLLDFSSAFDCLDHATLFERLEISYGIKGSALEWIKSYFSGRFQRVTVRGSLSQSFPLRR